MNQHTLGKAKPVLILFYLYFIKIIPHVR